MVALSVYDVSVISFRKEDCKFPLFRKDDIDDQVSFWCARQGRSMIK